MFVGFLVMVASEPRRAYIQVFGISTRERAKKWDFHWQRIGCSSTSLMRERISGPFENFAGRLDFGLSRRQVCVRSCSQ